jgi:hypothetical protein
VEVALSEALDVLHRVMHPASYCRIRMAFEIANDSHAFFVILFFIVTKNLW